MILNEKEFLKKKNRKTIYRMCLDSVNTYVDRCGLLENKIAQLIKARDEHISNKYIWNFLNSIVKDTSSTYIRYPIHLGNICMSDNHYMIDPEVCERINVYILRVEHMIGRIDNALDLCYCISQENISLRK